MRESYQEWVGGELEGREDERDLLNPSGFAKLQKATTKEPKWLQNHLGEDGARRGEEKKGPPVL